MIDILEVFIFLKCCDVVDWPWWAVLAPAWALGANLLLTVAWKMFTHPDGADGR